MKKRVVVALGHRALGTTLPEQQEAVKKTSKVIADLIEDGYSDERIWKSTRELYSGANVCMFCHEPGLYRI